MSWESSVYPCGRVENDRRISFRPPGTACLLLREALRAAGALPLRLLATCRARLMASLYRRMAFPVF